MTGVIKRSDELVRYAALSDGQRLPLTWAQRTTWSDISYFLPDTRQFFVMQQTIDIPIGVGIGDVFAAVSDVVGSHEALRFRFESVGEGEVVQHVDGAGSLRVVVLEGGTDMSPTIFERHFAEAVDSLTDEMLSNPHRCPILPAVGVQQGVPSYISLAISHLAVDREGFRIVRDELRQLLVARAEGLVDGARLSIGATELHEEVAFQSSDAGISLSDAALAYRRKQLEVMTPSMLPRPVVSAERRYWRGTLLSWSLPEAVAKLTTRYKSTPSSIMLAAAVVGIRHVYGHEDVQFELQSGNRFTPRLRKAVMTLSQSMLSTVSARSDRFGDAVARSSAAILRSYRYGRYDPVKAAQQVSEVEANRGVTLDLGCRFNYMVSPVNTPLAARDVESSTFRWTDQCDSDKISFHVDVFEFRDSVALNIAFDAHRVKPDLAMSYVYGIERLLLAMSRRELSIKDALTA